MIRSPHAEFADVLEQLESKFYSEALAKFKESDFTSAGFPNAQLAIEQFVSIQSDEATHSVALRVRLQISAPLRFDLTRIFAFHRRALRPLEARRSILANSTLQVF